MSRIEEAMKKAREQAARQRAQDHLEQVTLHPKVAPKSAREEEQVRLVTDADMFRQPQAPQDTLEEIDLTSRRLVATNEFNLPITEEYRKLKTTIVQLVNKEPSKNMFMVTSSVGGEGKSITALNLAISLAQEHDKRVLLIDTDLRKPSILKYLGLSLKNGLAEYLKENLPLDDVLLETGLGNLVCLPAGASDDNPVELYSSQKMRSLLVQVRERFNGGYIIIDTSPVLPFAEARIIAALVDSVVYVVKEGGTTLKNIEEGINALGEATVVGLVYNKATTASLAGGYHYYYYDYARQYRAEPTTPKEQKQAGGFLSRFRKPKVTP